MEIAHILDELAYDMDELPRDAIESAIILKEYITPHLIKVLEDATQNIEAICENDNYQGHVYAMYLLAQFREKRAFPLIIKLISFPGETPHEITGDVLTEDLGRILASVCNGDIEPIKQLIENVHINEYVRAAAQNSLVTLVGCGYKSREEIIEYFRALFCSRLEKIPSMAWHNLVACSCQLYPKEIFSEIQQCFTEGLIDQKYLSLNYVEEILKKDRNTHLFQLFQNAELIEDTVTEMEKWLSLVDEIHFGFGSRNDIDTRRNC